MLSLRILFFQVSTKSYIRKDSMLVGVEIDGLVDVRYVKLRR